MNKDQSKQPHPAERPTDETIKETIESIVIAFVLAFAFRAYVVEAFVIPTGSMAPTLLGEHLRIKSPQSGYVFTIDRPQSGSTTHSTVYDPMTSTEIPLPPKFSVHAGDRILVQKYVYAMSKPRRWDVVVFKAPHDPHTNFIKRLVGLPQEQLRILDGNIYFKPNGGDWSIARKTERPKVQQAVWQPVYHSRYIPLDRSRRWQVPWGAIAPNADQWQIENRRSYTFEHDGQGIIEFDFQRSNLHSRQLQYPYNQRTIQPGHKATDIEDVRIAVTAQPERSGLELTLSTTARLNSPDSIESLNATFDARGIVRLASTNGRTAKSTTLFEEKAPALRAGKNTTLELWYVDQEASVWVNGRFIAAKTFDPTMATLLERRPPRPVPLIRISVRGSPVVLHDVCIDRDLYYTTNISNGSRPRGGSIRQTDGSITVETGSREVRLGPDEFFCLGDNSPRSHDSRYWRHVNPWISRKAHGGQARPGIVPAHLMIGKAFFVYFPASFPWKHGGPNIFPNFGQMRFIH